MSNKTLIVGTAVMVLSIVALAVIMVEVYTATLTINPVAFLAAVVVMLVGVAWLKKTGKT